MKAVRAMLGLAVALAFAGEASATTWYVHREAGVIVWAGQYQQVGYATEALDDQTSGELAQFLHPFTPVTSSQAGQLALGISVSSKSAALALATFAFDMGTQTDLSGIAATIALLGTFPDGGQGPYFYPDINGNPVAFASIAVFKSFYGAYAKLLQAIRTQGAIAAQGGQAQWPSNSVVLP
jgi:hypothetical protein